jgi:GTPase
MEMQKENALLISVRLPGHSLEEVTESFDELKELAQTAGANIADCIVQQRNHIDPKYFIGKGKVDEIKQLYINNYHLNLIIFNQELSLTQIRNLEKELGLKVITRTELIMDIFAVHAKTKTAKLQVELAQMEYELPRVTGKGIMMSRLGGGIGTRGPGEKQLEYDRRYIQKRIYLIRKKLEQLEITRQEQRKNRLENEFKIAIIGYTNSGKSTLLNTLTSADVPAEDKLFATLDTITRKLWLGIENNRSVYAVITDTVGFIRDIPHSLIESFHSTLADTLQADLLLHIIDISAMDFIRKNQVVLNTLKDIGADGIPVLICFNKIDLLSEEEIFSVRMKFPDAIFISAAGRQNIEILKSCLLTYYHSRNTTPAENI